MRAARLVLVGALLVLVTVVRALADRPSLAIGFYALIPIVLAAFWFGRRTTAAVTAAAIALYLGSELALPSSGLSVAELWIAAANRAAVYVGVAALVTVLVDRDRAMTAEVVGQRRQLEELESLRAALTPTALPARPRLTLATSFTPADGIVAGDFFLVVPGPADSTTVIVGDVVGHGLEAARCAAYVRTALATYATFSTDPVQLLRLANTALREKVGDPTNFVTVTCLNISSQPPAQVRWASAGHEPPWELDTAEPLPGGVRGMPLGLSAGELPVQVGTWTMAPGSGLIVFTDGLTEARPAHRPRGTPIDLYGEERARAVIRSVEHGSPADTVDALTRAVTAFAGGPLADDLCIVAFRTALSGPEPEPGEPPLVSAALRP